MKAIFVVGTDTNIGKTIVSAWLALILEASYWKPIQTGCCSDRAIIERISQSIVTYPESYIFTEAVSPFMAAKKANSHIDINKIVIPKSRRIMIIEGAGGVYAPINDDSTMIDLIKYCAASVVVVAANKLGTINHTVLTVEALKNHNINILGVILNGDQNIDMANKQSIEKFAKVKVIATLPTFTSITENNLKKVKLREEINV